MRTMKFFSLVLALALILGCVASCGQNPQELMQEAAAATANTPHIITVNLDFFSDDSTYAKAFEAMSIKKMKIQVDGNNLRIRMDLNRDVDESHAGYVLTEVDYTMTGGMLYMKGIATSRGQNFATKQKASLSNEQLEEFSSKMNPSQDIPLGGFLETEVQKSEDGYVIKCTGVTDALNQMARDVSSQIKGFLDGTVEISDASYVITIKDQKIASATLICTYKVTTKDQEVTFKMTSDMTYDYNAEVSISVPSDAASYVTVDYTDLIG